MRAQAEAHQGLAGRGIADAGSGMTVEHASVGQGHRNLGTEPLTVAAGSAQPNRQPVPGARGNVAKQLHGTIERSDNHIDAAVVIEIGKGRSVVKRGLLEVRSGAGRYDLESPPSDRSDHRA